MATYLAELLMIEAAPVREIAKLLIAGKAVVYPFPTRRLAHERDWPVRESHRRMPLANAASDEHSPTYRKYFLALGRGQYRLRDAYQQLALSHLA